MGQTTVILTENRQIFGPLRISTFRVVRWFEMGPTLEGGVYYHKIAKNCPNRAKGFATFLEAIFALFLTVFGQCDQKVSN